jgi:hypothetical protein
MKKILLLVTAMGLVLSAFASPTQAVSSKTKVTKPSAPTIVSVTSSKPKKGKVDLVVRISLPAKNGGSKITESKVSAGKATSCTMKKLKTSCIIKGVKSGKSLTLTATSRNAKGYGAKSARVKMRAGTSYVVPNTSSGSSSDSNYLLPKGTKNQKTSLTRVLSTKSEKWSDFAAFTGGNQSRSFISKTGSNSVASLGFGDITFATTGAIGLAKPEMSGSGSGLIAVDALGNSTDAISSGTASVRDFYVAPNGKFYVSFSSPVSLINNGPTCVLAEVEPTTGIPTCVDGTIQSVSWNAMGSKTNPPVQFDSAGNMFYVGTLAGKTVLRKYSVGSVSNLVNDNISISDYLVLADSSVIISGSTTSTQAQWIRRITPSGGLSTLVSGSSAQFLTAFNDGNVYFGIWGNGNFGVKRYLTSSAAVDPKYWISGNINTPPYPDRYFDAGAICDKVGRSTMEGFCGWYGSYLTGHFSILGSKNFAISGSRGLSGKSLMQYYPVVAKATSEITNVTLSQAVISNILLAGTNAAGTNLLTIYDTGNGNETVVIDATNEIEVYNMTYVASTNRIMFNGLRFADNQFVVGEISLS